MNKKIIVFLICTLLITTVVSVTGNMKIESLNKKIVNPLNPGSDYILCVKQTSDGGYIATGLTQTYGINSYDLWLVKTDSVGHEMWNKSIFYDTTSTESGLSVLETNDGKYLITGWDHIPEGSPGTIPLIKRDTNGNPGWFKNIGSNEYNNCAFTIEETSDGGYILTGLTQQFGAGSYDFWLIKTDSNGNEQWNKTYGGASEDWGFYSQIIDGGYIITGATMSYGSGSYDCWLIKTDSNGNELWNKTYGGPSSDQGNAVQQTSDGYIIIGSTSTFGDDIDDTWLIKTDLNGNEQWNKTWPGALTAGSLYEIKKMRGGISIQQTTGGYVFTGITDENDNLDAFLIKTDTNGNQQWKKTFGQTDIDEAFWVNLTSDGGFIIGGITKSYGTNEKDGWLIKTDSNGNEQWSKTFPPNPSPYIPKDPNPEDGETDVIINTHLSWTGGDPDGDTVTYDVYFGTTSPPQKVSSNQSDKNYNPGILDFDTEYFWKIVTWDDEGASANGPIWSFTTQENLPPYEPSNPDPADEETDVSINKKLTWEGGDPNGEGDEVTYDVYFGTSSPPPLVSEDQDQTEYDPDTMELATTYYWEIVSEDSQGLTTDGPIWSFTTEEEPNEPPTAPEIDGPTEGPVNTKICWTFHSEDPNGHQVKYIIDWGDQSSNETTFSEPCTPVKVCHTYDEKGTYIITASAEDENGETSTESTLEVKIPRQRSRFTFHPLILKFFERFPIFRQLFKTYQT